MINQISAFLNWHIKKIWLAIVLKKTEYFVWDLDGTLYFSQDLFVKTRTLYRNYYASFFIKAEKKKRLQEFDLLEKTQDWYLIIQRRKKISQKELIGKIEGKIDKAKYVKKDELLVTFFKKYPNHLIFTNSTREQAFQVLKKLGIPLTNNLKLISLEMLPAAKPAVEAFQILKQSLRQVPTQKITYIGDSLHSDILPAKKLGYKTIFINRWNKKSDLNKLSLEFYSISDFLSCQ